MAFDEITTRYRIEKIKTIGDAYMAAGGLPALDEESPKNTVLTALDMAGFINDRYNSRMAQGLPALAMRVGIHTGPVVAGIVGTKNFQYDIWRDTVNTASRMESSGQVGMVNISATTSRMIEGSKDFHCTHRGSISAKGKGDLSMYFETSNL